MQSDEIIRDWQEHAAGDEEDNFRFLRSLKLAPSEARVDRVARATHAEVFAAVDCTRCANCCKTMKPGLIEADIKRIAKHLGLTRRQFIADYLEIDTDQGGYRMKSLPCPFLGVDGRCRIYEQRPADCRSFPHTAKKGFIWRTYGHAANTLNCPAVYQIVREMRRRRRDLF